VFGGNSSEYGISLQSAYSVITHIDSTKYDSVLLGITRFGEWFYFSGVPERIKNDTWNNPNDCVKAIISPDCETHGVLVFDNNSVRSIRLDAVMPVLHGKNGEDGTVQGLLELAGIPIVGCNTLSSALCMDKDKAHKIVHVLGVPIPCSVVLEHDMDAETVCEQTKNLSYPLFVKPVKAGSSHGITRVLKRDELPAAVKLAYEYDDKVIIEENIPGFEVGCAVLGNDKLILGELGEIELAGGFFDYKEKYTPETYSYHVPARISPQKTEEIKNTAKRIYRALGCTGFARVDMFLTPSGEVVFNEVNTIPGFTDHSHYPHMLKAVGMTFEQIINTAIEQAVRE
jgi:D-alanine---D-serine ligase